MPYRIVTGRRLVLAAAAFAAALVAGPSASAVGSGAVASGGLVPPLNDSFAAATLLAGEVGEVTATNKEASKELGEPAHAGNAGGASVWFHWTADRAGTLTVLVNVPTFDTVLGVYTGSSVDALTEVASNDDFGTGMASRVTFPVVSGTNYRIAVDGVGGNNGPFRLRWRQGPVNDNFDAAQVITGESGSAEGVSFGATAEPGETTELSTASSWFRWTAPESGIFGFHLESAAGLTVYTGSSLGALTAVGETGWEVVFEAVAGTEYSVRVAGWSWNQNYPFELHWANGPANDAFADAVTVEGEKGSATGSNVFATVETGEPARSSHSVWYTWTAPATGSFRFDVWRVSDPIWSWVDTILTVYTGAAVDTLDVVTSNDDWYYRGLPGFGSAVSFKAVEGTTYSIAVDAWAYGPFGLRWYPGAIIFGKSGDDQIRGTTGRDFIIGMKGNDVLHGLGGNDVVVGGGGRDRLYGDGGADILDSRDWVRGNDEIDGGPGTDRAIRDRRDSVRNVP